MFKYILFHQLFDENTVALNTKLKHKCCQILFQLVEIEYTKSAGMGRCNIKQDGMVQDNLGQAI